MNKTTNWTRLLAEFLVIVVGVLVALGVDEWRQARDDQALEEEYLGRLRHDLERGRAMADSTRLAHSGALRNADFVLPYLMGEAGIPGDTATVLAALYRASRSLGVGFDNVFPRSTLIELQATGRLGLIQSPDLRTALLDLYTEVDGAGATLDLLPREYRDFVRRRLPSDLQRAVRSECSVYDTADDGPLECAIDFGSFDPHPLLREISGNTELAGDLNLSRQQLAISVGLMEALLVSTDSLLGLLETSR
jgi:hypothetical protein